LRSIIILLLLLLTLFLPVGAADTQASMVYSTNYGNIPVNSVDTNNDGSLFFVGLNNGTILCLNSSGNLIYNYLTPAAIKKIKSDQNGNLVYLTTSGNTGFINSAGTLIKSYTADAGWNVSDIDIAYDGSGSWWRLSNSSSVAMLNNTVGITEPYSDIKYGTLVWRSIGYDSFNGLVLLSNGNVNGIANNNLTLYNQTMYTGWTDNNPTKDMNKNATQILLDSFPYRQTIDISNGNSQTIGIRFIDSPYTTSMTYNGDSTFTYNASKYGKYFLWTYENNISTDMPFLNLSIWNTTSKSYEFSSKPTSMGNHLTFYSGNPSYTNYNNTGIANLTTDYMVIANNSMTWVAPAYAYYAYKINVTGGGGGGGDGYIGGMFPETGGDASVPTAGALAIGPGISYPIVIGMNGNGSGYHLDNGTDGGTSTAFGLTSLGGKHADGIYGSGNNAGESNVYYASSMWGMNGTDGGNGDSRSGGPGGYGYGAGGGRGGDGGSCSADSCKAGNGAPGAINFTYQTWIPQHEYGVSLATPVINGEEYQYTGAALYNVGDLPLLGVVNAIDIVNGYTTVSTTNLDLVYHIQISSYGFVSSSNIGNMSAITGEILDTKIATGSSSIEGRGNTMNINNPNAGSSVSYNTGSSIRSVDISRTNGLWTVAGGDDGKVYIYTKDDTSGWMVYYLGQSGLPIKSVAITYRGEYAICGRENGDFEIYDLHIIPRSLYAFNVDLFVSKGGVNYGNIPLKITEKDTYNSPLIIGNLSGVTDTSGRYTFSVNSTRYYIININNGEYITTYQASTSYPVITVNIPVSEPVSNVPYTYAANLNKTSGLITFTFTDANTADLNVRIYDQKAKSTVYSNNWSATSSVTATYAGSSNGSYKVVFNFTRLSTGHSYSDTVYLNGITGLSGISDQWKVVIAGFAILILMMISLSIGSLNISIKVGAMLLTGSVYLATYLGIFPATYYAIAATLTFITMLIVFRRGPGD